MKYFEHATDAGSCAHLDASAVSLTFKGTQFTALALPAMILLHGLEQYHTSCEAMSIGECVGQWARSGQKGVCLCNAPHSDTDDARSCCHKPAACTGDIWLCPYRPTLYLTVTTALYLTVTTATSHKSLTSDHH